MEVLALSSCERVNVHRDSLGFCQAVKECMWCRRGVFSRVVD